MSNFGLIRAWKEQMLKRLISLVSEIQTIYLVLVPAAIALLIIWLTLEFGGGDLLIPLALFVWGFMGLPMIIRREVPWLITIRGRIAVLEGIVVMVLSWAAAFIILAALLGGQP